jgi:multiple sugar transport system permease protein
MARPVRSLHAIFDNEAALGYLLLTPALVVLAIFLAYPLAFGLWLALTSASIGEPGRYIGFDNFSYLLGDAVFRQTILNTFEYTFVTVVFKLVLGLAMAAALNVPSRLSRFARAALLLPWIVPTALSTLAWLWMFDSTFSPFNWILRQFGGTNVVWLGQGPLPMLSLMVVNIWRGTPFFGVLVLAAMQTVPKDLYDAASVDGAGAWRRWLHVTLPTIRPVVLIVLLLSIITTFSDFQIIWILTRGGPINSTQVLATYAFQTGIQGTFIGLGAAMSVIMFPLLCCAVGVVLWLVQKD